MVSNQIFSYSLSFLFYNAAVTLLVRLPREKALGTQD